MLAKCYGCHFHDENYCNFLTVVCNIVCHLFIAKYTISKCLIIFENFIKTIELLLKPIARDLKISDQIIFTHITAVTASVAPNANEHVKRRSE